MKINKITLVLAFIYTTLFIISCSKNEYLSTTGEILQETEEVLSSNGLHDGIGFQATIDARDIEGEWNLIFFSGHRMPPKDYKKSEIIWTFKDQKLTQVNKIENYQIENNFTIVDTLGGNQLAIDKSLFANIRKLNKDSLVLIAEAFAGCGGSYILIK